VAGTEESHEKGEGTPRETTPLLTRQRQVRSGPPGPHAPAETEASRGKESGGDRGMLGLAASLAAPSEAIGDRAGKRWPPTTLDELSRRDARGKVV
jgi:hypothetical protein